MQWRDVSFDRTVLSITSFGQPDFMLATDLLGIDPALSIICAGRPAGIGANTDRLRKARALRSVLLIELGRIHATPPRQQVG
jgi:hypothetical protein